MQPSAPDESRVDAYINRGLGVARLAAASCGVLLAAQATAWLVTKITQAPNGFGRAADVLMHYLESFGYIYAFLATVLMLVGITLVIEPSDVGRWLRGRVFAPSLEIAEHMLSLALGVLFAEVLQNALLNQTSISSAAATFKLFAQIATTTFLAAAADEFLRGDFERVLLRLGKYRLPVTLAVAGLIILASLNDLLWHYNPTGFSR